MGYRDDFYTAENVIGYSGKLHDFPTVYFQTAAEAGHITQKHGTSQNVGRQAVFASDGYKIENRTVNGELRLVESRGGRVCHVSRSVLTAIGGMIAGDKAVLYQAIHDNPNEKLISRYDDKTHKLIDETMERHDGVMKQLLMPDLPATPPPLTRRTH